MLVFRGCIWLSSCFTYLFPCLLTVKLLVSQGFDSSEVDLPSWQSKKPRASWGWLQQLWVAARLYVQWSSRVGGFNPRKKHPETVCFFGLPVWHDHVKTMVNMKNFGTSWNHRKKKKKKVHFGISTIITPHILQEVTTKNKHRSSSFIFLTAQNHWSSFLHSL